MSSINLKPGQPALDARDLEPLVELYLAHVAPTVKVNTYRSYRHAVHLLRDWWNEVGPACDWQLTRTRLADFGRFLEQAQTRYHAPFAYHTRVIVLVRIRQLFRWAFEHDYISRNCAAWVPTTKGAPRERTALSIDTLTRLIDVAGQSRFGCRDQAILAVLIGTAIRRAECAALNVEDVSYDMGGVGYLLVRSGKGDRPRTVVFDDRTAYYLNRHLEHLGRTTGPLWQSRMHASPRLGGDAIYWMVKRTLERAGLPTTLAAPHDFRRAFATYWNRGRKGLAAADTLSKQLGHTSAKTTLGYILTDLEDVRQAYRSPFDFVAANEGI